MIERRITATQGQTDQVRTLATRIDKTHCDIARIGLLDTTTSTALLCHATIVLAS